MLGAHAMERVAAGAHLPTPWLFEPAKRPDDRADYSWVTENRADYCLDWSFLLFCGINSQLQCSQKWEIHFDNYITPPPNSVCVLTTMFARLYETFTNVFPMPRENFRIHPWFDRNICVCENVLLPHQSCTVETAYNGSVKIEHFNPL